MILKSSRRRCWRIEKRSKFEGARAGSWSCPIATQRRSCMLPRSSWVFGQVKPNLRDRDSTVLFLLRGGDKQTISRPIHPYFSTCSSAERNQLRRSLSSQNRSCDVGGQRQSNTHPLTGKFGNITSTMLSASSSSRRYWLSRSSSSCNPIAAELRSCLCGACSCLLAGMVATILLPLPGVLRMPLHRTPAMAASLNAVEILTAKVKEKM